MTTGGGHRLIEQSEEERKFKTSKPQEVIELIKILLKSLINMDLLSRMNLVTSYRASTPGLHCPEH